MNAATGSNPPACGGNDDTRRVEAAGPVDAQNAPTRSLENRRKTRFSTATTGQPHPFPREAENPDPLLEASFRPTDSAEEASLATTTPKELRFAKMGCGFLEKIAAARHTSVPAFRPLEAAARVAVPVWPFRALGRHRPAPLCWSDRVCIRLTAVFKKKRSPAIVREPLLPSYSIRNRPAR